MHNYNVGIFIYKVFMRLGYNLCNQVCKCMNNFLLLKDMVNVNKSWYDFCLYFKTHGNNFIILLIYIVQQTTCDIWDRTEFNRSQKPSESHIFCLQKIRENYFLIHENAPKCHHEGMQCNNLWSPKDLTFWVAQEIWMTIILVVIFIKIIWVKGPFQWGIAQPTLTYEHFLNFDPLSE